MSDLETYARTRDPQLRDELVLRHMPLVKFVARRMSGSLPDHLDLDDLVSMGAIGLMDAIEKFQPERGLKFSTYAVTRIRGEILDGLQRMEWAPKQVISSVRKIRRAQKDLAGVLGEEPTDEQLAAALGVDLQQVRAALQDDRTTTLKVLNTDRSDGHYDVLSDPLSEEQQTAGVEAELRQRVARALFRVVGDERRMLLMYYRDRRTLKEISEAMDISSSAAIQAHTRMIERLRFNLSALS